MTLSPVRQQAVLTKMLSIDRVWTTVQLQRRGLLTAADVLDLPRVSLTCRTRVTQPHSSVDLVFVGLDERHLERPQRELMHDAGLAEARATNQSLAGGVWKHLERTGHARGNLPDAVYEARGLNTDSDWGIEFDAGYPVGRIEAKLRAADTEGFSSYLWATTVRVRTRTVGELLQTLQAQQTFRHLRRVEVRFVDFWSIRGDPYQMSARTHKRISQTFAAPVWAAAAR